MLAVLFLLKIIFKKYKHLKNFKSARVVVSFKRVDSLINKSLDIFDISWKYPEYDV